MEIVYFTETLPTQHIPARGNYFKSFLWNRVDKGIYLGYYTNVGNEASTEDKTND